MKIKKESKDHLDLSPITRKTILSYLSITCTIMRLILYYDR